jgi:hypothetical protein
MIIEWVGFCANHFSMHRRQVDHWQIRWSTWEECFEWSNSYLTVVTATLQRWLINVSASDNYCGDWVWRSVIKLPFTRSVHLRSHLELIASNIVYLQYTSSTLQLNIFAFKKAPASKNNTFWMVTKMVLIQLAPWRKGVKIELISLPYMNYILLQPIPYPF